MYRRRNYYRPRNRRNRWRSRSPERQGKFGEFERDRRENYQIENDSDAMRSDRARNLRELNDLYSNQHNNTSGNLFSTPSSHQISQSPISYFPNLMDNKSVPFQFRRPVSPYLTSYYIYCLTTIKQ